MAKRRFKVEVTLSATYEIVADDEIFNENLADGITKGWHEIDYDEDKPTIQALVEDVAGMYLQTGGDGERMEPYGEIAEEGKQYQAEMSRQEKSPYCGGITIKKYGDDYLEVESTEIALKGE